MNRAHEIAYFLYNNIIDESFLSKDKIKFIHDGCFKETLNKIFNINIDCKYYEQAISGEGREKDKIDTIYSSSLQSLLIFSMVSKNKPIIIDGVEYTDVHFEYKNKVIGFPSSVDVVLTGKDKSNNNLILFIESKLYEIVRDSNYEGTFEVGPTYLSNDDDSYFKKLDLTGNDLRNLGVVINEDINCGEDSKTKIKSKQLSDGNKKGYSKIKPIERNLNRKVYVYSYGVKQTLSHLIGILNFNNPTENCSNELQKEYASAEKRYLLLYNMLPDFNEDDAPNKVSDFKEHIEKVKDVIEMKKINIKISVMSYQDLFNNNNSYFNEEMNSITSFYKLKK